VQNLNCTRDTCGTSRSQPVGVCTSDHYGSSPQAQRFDNVAATANTAIQQDFDAIAYACHNFRQNVQSRGDVIKLSAAVIGND
jgi:hypothetical protein